MRYVVRVVKTQELYGNVVVRAKSPTAAKRRAYEIMDGSELQDDERDFDADDAQETKRPRVIGMAVR